MHWLFLLPLSTGVLSGYICRKSSDDIAYMTATITIISLFISLIIAPWQLQLGILALVLLIAGKFWQSRSNPIAKSVPATEGEKKYLYRGVSYSQETAPTPVTEEVELKYRGVSLHSNHGQTPQAPSNKPRKYRGVTIGPDA